jgi:hypothetical protein
MSRTFHALSVIALVSSVEFGCTGSAHLVPPNDLVPEMIVVQRAPIEGERPPRQTESSWSALEALWLHNGKVVVVDDHLARRRQSATSFDALKVGAPGETTTLGAIRGTAQRAAGVFIATDVGVFHDAAERLLRSPASDSLPMSDVRSIDVTGNGADEVVWLSHLTADRVASARRESIEIADPKELGAVQVVVGTSTESGLLVRGGSLYRFDLSQADVRTLARGLARINAFARRADGAVLLATDEGLVVVGTDDIVTKHTLVAEGASPSAVTDLEPGLDGVLLMAAGRLLRFDGNATAILAEIEAPQLNGLTEDAVGNIFVISGNTLVRLGEVDETPQQTPSFANDVKPFMTARCASCHRAGAQYAPVIDFENFSVSVAWAGKVVERLTSIVAPMPPSSKEVLTRAQYSTILRWATGERKP